MPRLRSILVATITGLAGLATLVSADRGDVGELSGGSLTGPFINAAYLAALFLISGGLLAMMKDRASMLTTALGWLLALPWASWQVFPGLWCADGNCAISYPRFTADPLALAIVLLPPIAFALRRWSR